MDERLNKKQNLRVYEMETDSSPFASIGELRSFIQNDATLDQLQKEAAVSMGEDPGHDLYHCQRVALWTLRINPSLRVKNAIAAALLHDIVNLPKNDPRRHEASSFSADKARSMLNQFPESEFSIADIDDIYLAIRDHSFSRGATPETELGKALQDADRLEALGVLGALRNISCGTQMGAMFFNAEDPWGADRPLDDKRYSMDHYECKLFKLESKMNTVRGRQEARIRTQRLYQLLKDLGDEIGAPFQGFGNKAESAVFSTNS